MENVSTRDLIAPIIQRKLSAFLTGNMVGAISLDIADAVAVAVLARMGQGTADLCDQVESMASKCLKDLSGRRTSEDAFTDDERQQMCTFLGMIAAAKVIKGDLPLSDAAPRSPAEGGR